MTSARTLYAKLVDAHRVRDLDPDGRQVLLYVDRTVLNEYTSPQAFSALREAGRAVWRPEAALGVVDHVNPTAPDRGADMPDAGGQRQTLYFAENCRDFGIPLYDVLHPLQGIEHVVMPETGRVLPGMVLAAGDSHTTTYGALGALGFGIGTSDIEHYLATQTVIYRRLRSMQVRVDGDLPLGVTEDRVVGALDIERALTRGEKAFEPGLLARANRGYLYIDEVNLLEDHIVDLLLDVAQSGENVVEREGLSIRHPARFVLVGSGNPEEGELRPQLLDRFGLSVEVTSPRDIATRVESVSQGTEELAANTQQTATAAQELTRIAATLDQLAGRFRLS